MCSLVLCICEQERWTCSWKPRNLTAQVTCHRESEVWWLRQIMNRKSSPLDKMQMSPRPCAYCLAKTLHAQPMTHRSPLRLGMGVLMTWTSLTLMRRAIKAETDITISQVVTNLNISMSMFILHKRNCTLIYWLYICQCCYRYNVLWEFVCTLWDIIRTVSSGSLCQMCRTCHYLYFSSLHFKLISDLYSTHFIRPLCDKLCKEQTGQD